MNKMLFFVNNIITLSSNGLNAKIKNKFNSKAI